MAPDSELTADCCAAIRGEKVPRDLRNIIARSSLIRGMRLHLDFATSQDVSNLCLQDPQIARARNARLIMSDVIPSTMGPQQEPYCIWFPKVASEDTYRQLVQRYPQMRYQVGRACAAGGYDTLYEELDLLPDVSIAEEARESDTDGGRLIYDSIMSRSCRYSVMNDDTLTIQLDDPLSPAFLNGDTETRLQLYHRPNTPRQFSKTYPGIEEDMHINDEYTPPEMYSELEEFEVELLHQPLPLDLPTVKKKLLICMAAFEGNIDRYVRLSRATRGIDREETLCIVRGIYHHTMFARWWAGEITQNTTRVQAIMNTETGHRPLSMIQEAISARRIMINDPKEFVENGWPAGAPKPYLIWWPLRPTRDMLDLLAEKVPEMTEQVAVAAIYCDYHDVYRRLQPEPNWRLCAAARDSHNPFYLQDLTKRATERHINLDASSEQDPDGKCLGLDLEPTEIFNYYERQEVHNFITSREGPYGGFGPDCRMAEVGVWDSMGLPE
ncbi:hypothetical protein K4K53_006573 [Colletotrichum sp. SAR 10_77]|nr:hypothetical protein K4K53_006573 [Colletotrichum sp. SAR 10_77]